MVYLNYYLISLLFFIFHYYIIILYHIVILILDHQWFSIFFLEICIIPLHSSSQLFLNYSMVKFLRLLFLTFDICSAISLPVKSPVASAVFWIAFFEAVLSTPVANCLAWYRSFWLYLLLTFLLTFLWLFFPYFWHKTKIHSLLQIFDISVKLNIVSFFICYT